MIRGPGRPERVKMPYIEQLAERLSTRDQSIISTVHRLRLASGTQLERLHFYELSGRSRSVKRGQVLKRLVNAGVLMPLPRRIGTAQGGSARQKYTLDSAGQHLARLQANHEAPRTLVRRPRPPSGRFAKHTLAVSELYVELMERSREGGFKVVDFLVEGAAYWPDGLGGWLKPDAFVQLERGTMTHYWWYEADMGTEDLLTTIPKKLMAYLNFVQRGQLGPDDVMPRVLIGVSDRKRQDEIQAVVEALPDPASALFGVAELVEAVKVMAGDLMGCTGGIR
jgi:hypothetical protein